MRWTTYVQSFVLASIFTSQANAQQAPVVTIEEQILSCSELLEQIRISDCGSHIANFFANGYIAAGAAGNTLSATARYADSAARFSGGVHITPYVSLNTGLEFFPGSDLGWDFSIGWEQAHVLKQKIKRNGDSVTRDLDSFAIASTFSSEASLFYSWGARDSTPRQYALLGIGFGVGYGDVVGKAYFTEELPNSDACYQAGQALVDGTAGAQQLISDNCTLKSFRRVGFGVSGRLNIDVRYENFYLSFDTTVLNLSSGTSLSLGSHGLSLSPVITAVTLSYIYNL